jgi:hypothetical protein
MNITEAPSRDATAPEGLVEAWFGPHDVLLGRNRYAFNNLGNKRFRNMIIENANVYIASPSRTQKSQLVATLIARIHQNGGRFLRRQEDGVWFEVDTRQAKEKVGHALRDGNQKREDIGRSGQSSTSKAYVRSNKDLHDKMKKRSMIKRSPSVNQSSTTIQQEDLDYELRELPTLQNGILAISPLHHHHQPQPNVQSLMDYIFPPDTVESNENDADGVNELALINSDLMIWRSPRQVTDDGLFGSETSSISGYNVDDYDESPVSLTLESLKRALEICDDDEDDGPTSLLLTQVSTSPAESVTDCLEWLSDEPHLDEVNYFCAV